MSKYHILIVDDQRDVRRVLSAGLQTLGQQMEVVEVPSAEEALLIAPRRSYDLIVTDVRLPGMSGLELVKRIKLRNPSIKIILMTGAEDRQTRRQVEDAGVFAFFYKPIEMADFLDAVERALGLVETVFSPPPLDLKLEKSEPPPAENLAPEKIVTQEEPGKTAASRASTTLAPLAILVSEPSIRYAALLNKAGKTLSEAGECQEWSSAPGMLAALLSAAQANSQLSAALARPVPDYSLFLDGSSLSVGLTPIGKDHLLLVVGSQSFQSTLARVGAAMHGAVGDLLEHVMAQRFHREPALGQIETVVAEITTERKIEETPKIPTEEDLLVSLETVEVSQDDLAAIEDLFGGSTSSKLKVDSLDDFWDSAVEETGSVSLNESHISYDEARNLGLAPE